MKSDDLYREMHFSRENLVWNCDFQDFLKKKRLITVLFEGFRTGSSMVPNSQILKLKRPQKILSLRRSAQRVTIAEFIIIFEFCLWKKSVLSTDFFTAFLRLIFFTDFEKNKENRIFVGSWVPLTWECFHASCFFKFCCSKPVKLVEFATVKTGFWPFF